MKSISKETNLLIEHLYHIKNKSWIKKIFSSGHDYAEIIEKIGDSGEPSAIIHMAPLLFSENRAIQAKLAETIAKLLKSLSQEDYVTLDQRMRSYSSYYYDSLHLKQQDISSFSYLDNFSWIPLSIATMSRNGFVREKSVILLGDTNMSEVVPFLLLRANDWNVQVRSSAVKSLLTYISLNNTSDLINNLYLISRLEYSRSNDDGEIKKQIFTLLQKEENKIVLKNALSHKSKFIRRTCYQLSLSSPYHEPKIIIQNGFSDTDIIVRLYCYNKLIEMENDPDISKILLALVNDHFMPIRRGAISILSKINYLLVEKFLYNSLCDNNISIRQLCRKIIANKEPNLPDDYFIKYYVDCLKSDCNRFVNGAIAGIGEIGNKTFCAVIEPFLKHKHAKIRKTAIRALFKLNSDAFLETFYRLLMTDSESVGKEVVNGILHSKSYISGIKLLALFNQTSDVHRKLNILRILNSVTKWERITMLLKTCIEENEIVFEQSNRYLNIWLMNFNKGSTSTSVENLVSARNALSEVRHKLDARLCERLDFCLK